MKKRILLSICLLSFALILFGQNNNANPQRVKGERSSSNSFYLGILGPTLPLSLNYDYIITKNGVVNVAGKIGGAYTKFKNQNNLVLANGSFEVLCLIGRSKHLFEMGIGWVAHYGSFYSDEQQKTKHYGVPTSTFTMHYRFQSPEGGIFFKAGFAAHSILAIVSSDLKEAAIANIALYGFEYLTGEDASFSLLSFGIGYAIP